MTGSSLEMVDIIESSHDYLGEVAAGITPAHLPQPSMCRDWTTEDVLNHLLEGLTVFAAGHGGTPVERAGHIRDVGPAELFIAPIQHNLAFWRSPGSFDGEIELPIGRFPAETAAMIECIELVVHGWDAAQGAGLDLPIPEHVAATLLEFCGRFDLDSLRAHGALEQPIDCPPTAPSSHRLLSLLGRRPPT